MKKYLSILLGLIILVAIAWYGVTHRQIFVQAQVQTVNATYSCDGGKMIYAVFYNRAPLPASTTGTPPVPQGTVSAVLSDGQKMTLKQTISASGARYANADESFVFWNKGNTLMILENGAEKEYIGCIAVAPQPTNSNFTQAYSSGIFGFSLRTLDMFVADAAYVYQMNPKTQIPGVKFTIPATLAQGTNLAQDTYISVERLSRVTDCRADMFIDGSHTAVTRVEDGITYSVASSSNAGAGNRYEETVYAIPGTSPCLAVRYFVHYGAIQNYDPGTVKEFDRVELLGLFDVIRSTLVFH